MGHNPAPVSHRPQALRTSPWIKSHHDATRSELDWALCPPHWTDICLNLGSVCPEVSLTMSQCRPRHWDGTAAFGTKCFWAPPAVSAARLRAPCPLSPVLPSLAVSKWPSFPPSLPLVTPAPSTSSLALPKCVTSGRHPEPPSPPVTCLAVVTVTREGDKREI
jgi:hypothetical protein